MGIEYSTAKWLAPVSFVYDFAMQQYGLNSTPSMKDVNDANTSFWSPQPYFIGAFFAPQQIVQLAWLYRLYKLDPSKPKERSELDQIVNFVPYYALGNFCIGSKLYPFPLIDTIADCIKRGWYFGTIQRSRSPTCSLSSTLSASFTLSSPSSDP